MNDDFELGIICNGHRQRINKDGPYKYCPLKHNSTYKLYMKNNTYHHCDASVTIDGEHVGTWRINYHKSIEIERPVHADRKFTFVRENSYQAHMGNINPNNENNGLVVVKFIPGKTTYRSRSSPSTNLMCNEMKLCYSSSIAPVSNFSSGGTVLGEHSSQSFKDASNIDRDYASSQTLAIRLVCDEGRPPSPPIIPLSKKQRFNDPIPPKIDGLYYNPYHNYGYKTSHHSWHGRDF